MSVRKTKFIFPKWQSPKAKDKFVQIKDNEEYKSILVSSRTLMDNRQFYIKEFDNNYYFNFK